VTKNEPRWTFKSEYRYVNIYAPLSNHTIQRCSFMDFKYTTNSTKVATALLSHKDHGDYFWIDRQTRR
jgi:hypothetical protein